MGRTKYLSRLSCTCEIRLDPIGPDIPPGQYAGKGDPARMLQLSMILFMILFMFTLLLSPKSRIYLIIPSDVEKWI